MNSGEYWDCRQMNQQASQPCRLLNRPRAHHAEKASASLRSWRVNCAPATGAGMRASLAL
jgi:hypothetical protein